MPRINPVLESDKRIAERLRQLREKLGMTRVRFCQEFGQDSTRYANYEYGSVPIPCEVALRVMKQFDVNERWLAAGEGAMFGYAGIEQKLDLTKVSRQTFGEVYESFLKPIFDEFKEHVEVATKTLFSQEAVASKSLRDCVDTLNANTPADKRHLLVAHMWKAGRDFESKYLGKAIPTPEKNQDLTSKLISDWAKMPPPKIKVKRRKQ